MPGRVVTALFEHYADAEAAIERLEAAGIAHADIAIMASGSPDAPELSAPGTAANAGEDEAAAASTSSAGAGTGATVGGVVGGGAGLLAGAGMLAVPGLGIPAAGWLATAVTGAGLGAAAGSVIGGLSGTGTSDGEAAAHAQGIRHAGTLITVRADESRSAQVLAILDEAGSIDLDQRMEGWPRQGWSGGTRDETATAGRSARR